VPQQHLQPRQLTPRKQTIVLEVDSDYLSDPEFQPATPTIEKFEIPQYIKGRNYNLKP